MMSVIGGRADAAESYANAGLGGRFERGRRPGVLVVDFQLGFTQPPFPLASDLTGEIEATRRLLDVARRSGAPVAFTAISIAPDARDAGIWLQKVQSLRTLTPATGADRIDERLARLPEEPLFLKRGPSAWYATGFREWVQGRVDSMILCGATTSGCVRATAVDLLEAQIPVFVVKDCVGDRAITQHHASLLDLDAKYADVLSLEQAVSYLGDVAPTSQLSTGVTYGDE